MTDFEKVQHSDARYRAAAAKANALNKTVVFDALAAAGVTSVTITFDGEGDSGQIESITAHTGSQEAHVPVTALTVYKAEWHREALTPLERVLPYALEELCYGYLGEKYPGWELNDGAYGEFRFEVASRTIELEFNGRVTDVVTSTHKL